MEHAARADCVQTLGGQVPKPERGADVAVNGAWLTANRHSWCVLTTSSVTVSTEVYSPLARAISEVVDRSLKWDVVFATETHLKAAAQTIERSLNGTVNEKIGA
jgi:hypothetical protein